MLDLNVLNYLKERNQWLPSLGKAPLRINTSSEKWNEKGNQYSLKECIDYKLSKQNKRIQIGYTIFKDDRILVIDIDGITEQGIEDLKEKNIIPLNFSMELNTLLNTLNIEGYIIEKSISGKGIHIYLLVDSKDKLKLKSVNKINTTLNGFCKHVEIFAGDTVGKFVVFAGNIIKDSTIRYNKVTNVIDTEDIIHTKTPIIYTNINELPEYSKCRIKEKVLEICMQSNNFNSIYTTGRLVEETDIDINTLEIKGYEVTDVSKKAFMLVSTLVKICQNVTIIDSIFKDSYIYKETKWGKENKWERLLTYNNNANPILSAYNYCVSYAKNKNLPEAYGFSSPYRADIQKELDRTSREQKKSKKINDSIDTLKIELFKILDDDFNKYLFTEYSSVCDEYIPVDLNEITEESLEDYSFISQLFWRTHPYIFALNNDVYGTWIYYYKDYTYRCIYKKQLDIIIENFYLKLFPFKTHSVRANLSKTTCNMYVDLNKPILTLTDSNSFIYGSMKSKLYYHVQNGILDVYDSKITPHTPNFLSFTKLPFNIDSEFLHCLKNKNTSAYIKGTDFEKFIYTSFPLSDLKKEYEQLLNDLSVIPLKDNPKLFKPTCTGKKLYYGMQISVLQKMLGYLLLPRRILSLDKTLILYGVAGSGKSTLAKLFGYLLTGNKNLNNLTTTFQDLESNQYALSPFKVSPLMVVNELPDKVCNNLRGKLNSLISGEALPINEKYCTYYTSNLPCKILLIGNVLPRIQDDAGSLGRRSIIINFKYNVSKTEHAIENIDDILIEDKNLKAFFLFCLHGALDYLKDTTPLVSFTSEKLVRLMNSQNNDLERLFEEAFTFTSLDDVNSVIPITNVKRILKYYIDSDDNITGLGLKMFNYIDIEESLASIIAKHYNVALEDVIVTDKLARTNNYCTGYSPKKCLKGISTKSKEGIDEFK